MWDIWEAKNDSNRKASEKSIYEWFTNSITSEGYGGFNNKEWISRKNIWAEKNYPMLFIVKGKLIHYLVIPIDLKISRV